MHSVVFIIPVNGSVTLFHFGALRSHETMQAVCLQLLPWPFSKFSYQWKQYWNPFNMYYYYYYYWQILLSGYLW